MRQIAPDSLTTWGPPRSLTFWLYLVPNYIVVAFCMSLLSSWTFQYKKGITFWNQTCWLLGCPLKSEITVRVVNNTPNSHFIDFTTCIAILFLQSIIHPEIFCRPWSNWLHVWGSRSMPNVCRMNTNHFVTMVTIICLLLGSASSLTSNFQWHGQYSKL